MGGGARVALERRVLLADVGESRTVERPPEGRQLGSDCKAGNSERRVRDPDEAPHRSITERGPPENESPQDATRELPSRRTCGGRGAGHDLVELPGLELRARVGRDPHGVAVARAELDAPRDARGSRAEPGERRDLAGEALRHQRLVLGRQASLLAVPILGESEHRRVAPVCQLRDLPRDCDVGAVTPDVHGDVCGQPRPPDLRQEVRNILWLEVREQDEPLQSWY